MSPTGAYPTADDYIAALSPRTRVVSVSLVRFNDGSMLDARPLADACHARGALLCLDVSQCCGAMPIDVASLRADFLTCAGYKWLLSPYGTGFFWIRRDHIERMRPGPFYWMATEGADDFSALRLDDPRPVAAARRWDTPEWAGSFNPNMAGMASAGIGGKRDDLPNRQLLRFEQLPRDKYRRHVVGDRGRLGEHRRSDGE